MKNAKLYFGFFLLTILISLLVGWSVRASTTKADDRPTEICAPELQEDLSALNLSQMQFFLNARLEEGSTRAVWITSYSYTQLPSMNVKFDERLAQTNPQRWERLQADLNKSLFPQVGTYLLHIAGRDTRYTSHLSILVKGKCAEILKEGPIPDSKRPWIVESAAEGDLRGVELALDFGNDVNSPDEDGNTALLLASQHDNASALVDLLLRHGANPNVFDKAGGSALAYSGLRGDFTSVNALIVAHADVNHTNLRLETPLKLVCSGSRVHRELAPTLMEHGVQIAASQNEHEIVKALLHSGADPNLADTDGDTPLHAAASWGDAETIDELLAAGADPNARNKTGERPLEMASKCIDVRGEACRKALEILQPITR